MSTVERTVVSVELADGTVHENILTTIADRVSYSQAAQKRKWPSPQQQPDVWIAFLAWSALTRHGLYSGSWEAFSRHDAVAVTTVDDTDVAPASPTRATTGHA